MMTLGIDPGSKKTGLAFLKDNRIVETKLLESKYKDIDRRYKYFALKFDKILNDLPVDLVGMETPYVYRYPRSCIVLAEMRGIYKAILYNHIDAEMIFDIAPKEAKKYVTGKGNASKKKVYQITKNMISKKIEYDESDAIAIALTTKGKYDESRHIAN